jgi:hypothetical protein
MLRSSLVALTALIFACSSARKLDDDRLGGAGGPGQFDLDGGLSGQPEGGQECRGWQCYQVECGAGGKTTVTGTVYAPDGKLPLYNVVVYVPNAPPAPMPQGVTCDKCGTITSGEPVVTALTNHEGKFVLENVPVGKTVPLVMQLGKWRREVVIPEVKACEETALTDRNLTRLPRNRTEGDLPKIAVTVGNCDKLSCMLPKVGIDPAEFGVDGEAKAVHFYQPRSTGPLANNPPGPKGMKDARALWSDAAKMREYDIIVFSCECNEALNTKDGDVSWKAVTDYLAAGGRIFTTDFQYVWYKNSPDPNLKGFAGIPGGAPVARSPVVLDTSFPKGKALADWLKFADPASEYGKVKCDTVFNNFTPADKARAQTWGTSGEGPGANTNPRFLTVNTPAGLPAEQQCGKAVHLDAHINGSDTINDRFPQGCSNELKQGERAFAFFFFDLASCIQDESEPPRPPIR